MKAEWEQIFQEKRGIDMYSVELKKMGRQAWKYKKKIDKSKERNRSTLCNHTRRTQLANSEKDTNKMWKYTQEHSARNAHENHKSLARNRATTGTKKIMMQKK